VKDLYNEKYKTLKALGDGKTSHIRGIRIHIVKMTVLPKVIYRFNTIPMTFFIETEN
jgi:hypothetical protein